MKTILDYWHDLSARLSELGMPDGSTKAAFFYGAAAAYNVASAAARSDDCEAILAELFKNINEAGTEISPQIKWAKH